MSIRIPASAPDSVVFFASDGAVCWRDLTEGERLRLFEVGLDLAVLSASTMSTGDDRASAPPVESDASRPASSKEVLRSGFDIIGLCL